MPHNQLSFDFGNIRQLFARLRKSRQHDEELARSSRHLQKALAQDKHEGHRIAIVARTVALAMVAMLLPFLNPNWDVLYYEFMLLVFAGLGLLQWRYGRVGRSGMELLLILADITLLTIILVTPNPFLQEEVSGAFVYRFDNFIYFFIFLATATLAYSWRTVWSIGTWVAILWLAALLLVVLYGHEIPGISEGVQQALAGYPRMAGELDPNGTQPDVRFQEAIVFIIVAGILALKSWRSNQLLFRQASIAAERANLSRYFPPNMVDLLAASDFDPGAVRTQEVAVLFTDIVGFTEIAERERPEDVMNLLRRYHAAVEKAIFENHGTLDKYLGDGVMATFGTPKAGDRDALNALSAAQQIIADTSAMNDALDAGGIQLKVSVGVHFGPVIMGDIGPRRRLEFAVLGDTVNVASRLESSTRKLGCRICCSDALINKAGGDKCVSGFKRRKGVKLRGRNEPLTVWTA